MVLNEGPDAESIGCGFNAFEEIEEVKKLVDTLNSRSASAVTIESNRDRFKFILSLYQEQPHLLDPFLDDILRPMLELVKNDEVPEPTKHNTFKYMFLLMNVKGYKKIVTYLPHEVMDLLPVLRLLEKQDPRDLETWETRYVLLIWLSIISKIPFPLSRLETSENVEPSRTILGRILNLCKQYCVVSGACPKAAVFLISNFLTRSDVKSLHLEEMIMWCLKSLGEEPTTHGPLAVLASILKHSAREDIKPHCQTIFDSITRLELGKSGDLVCRYEMKVIQRIGLILLRPKLAAWRYKKTGQTISLLQNSSKIPVEAAKATVEEVPNDSDEEDVPPVTEEIIEHLIQGLRDKVITIRWSAAKGIARITSRLPVDLGDEVVGFVLNLFSGREQDTAWHGGCLALAELGRRGLLLPHRLPDVIPVVLRALVFDEPRAYGSIGRIIRDAACYVCWSFARAFEPHVFQPHVQQIASTLLIVTCFDREINCRRAGSAAFQENVGRQGNFPYGIDILTVADYFEVGVRSNAYLKISVHIAQYKEYTVPIIDHLVQRKIGHWDTAIRELSAKALGNLTFRDVYYMVETVLPTLIDNLGSVDLNVRHGSILAIAEILEALHQHFNESIETIIGVPEVEEIKKIVGTFRARGQFRGLGGELMKQACATLINKCSQVHFPVHGSEVVGDWQRLLEECLCHEVAGVRLKSAEAHTHLFREYYSDDERREDRDAVVRRYLENLRSSHQTVRIGFAEALGYCPTFLLKERFEDIVSSLILCSRITEETSKWAESRKKALQSLTMAMQTLGVREVDIWRAFVPQMFGCYLLALKEYTIDSRGDIGAWVREAAMSGLHVLTNLVAQAEANVSEILNEEMMTEIVGGIAQQAVERIDRTRVQAGMVFCGLLYREPRLPNIPHHQELREIFPNDECRDDIDWKTESHTFPRFIRMLGFPEYVEHLLRGIIFSVGGLSESLVKYSSVSLFTYLNGLDGNRLEELVGRILDIFEESHRQERMVTAILAFLDRLLSSGCVQVVLDDPESPLPERMLGLLKRELKCMSNVKHITASIKVFSQLLQVRGSVGKQAFTQLSILLCNKFQCIRKVTATRIYEAFTLYGEDMDLPEENLSNILTELNETDWEQPVETTRPKRNHLCELMGVPIPVIRKRAT
ncbi:tubulin-specific chaperone D [Diachasma alloeum]|uniref:tubulin-specific chaperone D n=1 Tax=Diachasma alloeum TaxID=454923 RepID=UPI0007383FEA|nr:tubulin-specific chaperone D [Diachasma alloeum]